MNSVELLAHPLSVWLLATFGSRLRDMQAGLSERFPDATFFVSHLAFGALTSGQGVGLGIEALFPRDVPGESDNLAFAITISHLDGVPLVNAGLSWGQRDGGWTAADAGENWLDRMPVDFFPGNESPVATPVVLACLEADFARLVHGFEECVSQAFEMLAR